MKTGGSLAKYVEIPPRIWEEGLNAYPVFTAIIVGGVWAKSRNIMDSEIALKLWCHGPLAMSTVTRLTNDFLAGTELRSFFGDLKARKIFCFL